MLRPVLYLNMVNGAIHYSVDARASHSTPKMLSMISSDYSIDLGSLHLFAHYRISDPGGGIPPYLLCRILSNGGTNVGGWLAIRMYALPVPAQHDSLDECCLGVST